MVEPESFVFCRLCKASRPPEGRKEGNEIFEITDFTTATELERFIARIEEVIHEWKLTQEPFDFSKLEKFDINLAEWKEVVDEICFADFPFLITRFYINPPPPLSDITVQSSSESAQQEASGSETHHKKEWPVTLKSMYNNKYDFPAKAHCLCRWYGLTDFVVISPKSYSLTNQDRINTVMSAIACAIQNSSCVVPVFLQALEEWRKYYLGTFQYSNIETSFDMVHLKKFPAEYKNLYGLLEIFKQKLNISVEPANKAVVSIRFTYILQDWEEYMFDWPQAPPDMEGSGAMESAAVGFTSIDCLPFGACEDPVEDMYLFTTWANFSEGVIADTEVFSELEPPGAPQWTVRVTMSPNTPCLLADCLQKFIAVCGTKVTFDQVLGRQIQQAEENESVAQISNALERLTDPQTQYNIPSLSKVTKAVTDTSLRLSTRSQQESPIPVGVLNKILVLLFPDAKSEEDNSEDEEQGSKVRELKALFRFFKTAPVDSLVYRLAVCCSVVNFAFGGLKAVAHIWHEFVLEMRYRLENSILLPGLEKGAPNMALGILYQKLQMLNCCIEQKIQRNSRSKRPDTSASHENITTSATSSSSTDDLTKLNTPAPQDHAGSPAASDGNETEDSEEFYECDSAVKSEEEEEKEEEEEDNPSSSVEKSSSQSLFEDSMQYEQPQGRLRRLEDMTPLNCDDEPLYIPETQEPAPMTEDTLAEHADVLTKLGTSTEGANLRARMQSASLLSDMESFKAANPGCILEDFVRWYSPRDYVMETIVDKDTGETVKQGMLSERMLAPGNMWQEVWDSAKPIPAHRQKRLFNDTKEAERVLHFLSNLAPAQVGLHLLPIVCQAALVITKSQEECQLMPSIMSLLDSVTNKLEKKTRLASQSSSIYSDTANQLRTAELVIARARSLNLKFACSDENKDKEDINKFVLELMQQEEVKVVGAARGPVGKAIHKMFVDAKSMRSNTSDNVTAQYTQNSDSIDIRDGSVYPPAAAKEFILRVEDPRPAPYSEHLPHRMYCTLVDGKEYRIAGAFSSDSTFV